MSLIELRQKIQNKDAKLGVIGLGYVGLAVACEFSRVGFMVTGIDINLDRIDQINQGKSPIEGEEPELSDLLVDMISAGRLIASSNYQELANADVILICVETPVGDDHKPKYNALLTACDQLGQVLKKGTLVIIESTVAPGTCENIVKPALEKSTGMRLGDGFYLGTCPERVMPGKLLKNLRSMNRVCGASNLETSDVMISLYREIVKADLDPSDLLTAELVKTTENAYRDVQIAFANEAALICEAIGGDVWRVRELVNKNGNRQMHLPGAGVGGHCIPKDPWLLVSAAVSKNFAPQLIPTSRGINDSMPQHIVRLTIEALSRADREIQSSRILVLGYAYLENSDDTRNSPSEVLFNELKKSGASVAIQDPYVREFYGDVYKMAEGSDAIIVMVRHKPYQALDLVKLKTRLRTAVMIDGRNLFDPEAVIAAGYIFSSIGRSLKLQN